MQVTTGLSTSPSQHHPRNPSPFQSTPRGQSQPIKPAPLGRADDFSLKEPPSHHHATEEGVRSPTHESRASCTCYKATGLLDDPKISLIKTRNQILKIDMILFWTESRVWFWSSSSNWLLPFRWKSLAGSLWLPVERAYYRSVKQQTKNSWNLKWWDRSQLNCCF